MTLPTGHPAPAAGGGRVPAPRPSTSPEGAEAFAALLAGAMLTPPAPPVSPASLRGAGAPGQESPGAPPQPGAGSDVDAGGEASRGEGRPAAGESASAAVDPRALLMRAFVPAPTSHLPTPAKPTRPDAAPATPTAGASPPAGGEAAGLGPTDAPSSPPGPRMGGPGLRPGIPLPEPAARALTATPRTVPDPVPQPARGPGEGRDAPPPPSGPPEGSAGLPHLRERSSEAPPSGSTLAGAEGPAPVSAQRGPGSARPGGAPAAAPLASVHSPNRDPGLLDPAFRTRLERVVERLAKEHGIRARFLEGYRPQLRQEHLYAQGRTAPGPVVTWTRDSMHTRGLAADLKLDGEVTGPEAYRILHRIAEEEGLRTLGMKDPGHVELRRGEGASLRARSGGVAGVDRSGDAGTSGGGSAGHAPDPAEPGAGVAPVARVARVAGPALPGVHRGTGAGRTPPPPTPQQATGSRPAGAVSQEPVPFDVTSHPPPGGREAEGMLGQTFARAGGPTEASAMRADGPTPADRAAGVDLLRATAPLGPMRRVEVRDVDGEGTRVRIELRGESVRTEVHTSDAELARRLEPAAGELERSLERHGLELGRLRVARAQEVPVRELLPLPDPRGSEGNEDEATRHGSRRSAREEDPTEHHTRQRPRDGGGGRKEER